MSEHPTDLLSTHEQLLLRIARLERQVEFMHNSLPQRVMQVVGQFLTAAARNRNQPNEFGFDFYKEGEDSIGDTFRVLMLPEGPAFFAYAGPDKWVAMEWLQPESLWWHKAVAFMQEHDLLDAHLKMVQYIPNPEPVPDVQH